MVDDDTYRLDDVSPRHNTLVFGHYEETDTPVPVGIDSSGTVRTHMIGPSFDSLVDIEGVLEDAEVAGGGLYINEMSPSTLESANPMLHDNVTLTNFYSDNVATAVDCSTYKELHLMVEYDPAVSGNIMSIMVEFTYAAASSWYQETAETYTGDAYIGEYDIDPVEHLVDTSGNIVLPTIPLQGNYVRTSVKENGGAGGTASVIAMQFGR